MADKPIYGTSIWESVAKVRVGTTPAEDAAARKRKEEEEALKAKRQQEIQEESRAQKAKVSSREGQLLHIREQFMFKLLPQSSTGLPDGDDIREAALILQCVERIDGLIGYCSARKLVIDERMEKLFRDGATPFRLDDLLGKNAPAKGEKGSK